jgi:hypothetical protein
VTDRYSKSLPIREIHGRNKARPVGIQSGIGQV